MGKTDLLRRITVNPNIFGGKPIIRGLRIKVESILALMEQGVTMQDMLEDFPDMELNDIKACLAFARTLVANESIDAINFEVAK
jgi:uncharacterized protein (DUF433 family)